MGTLLCVVTGEQFAPTMDSPAVPITVTFSRKKGRRRWLEKRVVPASQAVLSIRLMDAADPAVQSWSVTGRDGSRDTSQCVSCGLPVSVAVDGRRKVAYCSTRCRGAYYRQRDNPAAGPVECSQCGEEFAGRVDAQFCSPSCRQKAYRARKKEVPGKQ